MPRTRKSSDEVLKEKIAKAQADVEKAQQKLKEAKKALAELREKQDSQKKDQIFSAIADSDKSLDDILQFIQSK